MTKCFSNSIYHLQANLGSEKSPFIVKHELGHFENDLDAYSAGESFLDNCPHDANWIFFKDGKETNLKLKSGFTLNQTGLKMNIVIKDDNFQGLEEQLKDIFDLFNNGHNTYSKNNEKSNFEFEIKGEEVDPNIKKHKFALHSHKFVIFDNIGIIKTSNDENLINDIFEHKDTKIDEWSGTLNLVQSLTLEEALTDKNARYEIISKDELRTDSGKISDILSTIEFMKDNANDFYLFKLIKKFN